MRYDGRNLRLPHDIHYSWAGWPTAGSRFPDAPPEALFNTLAPLWRTDGLTLEAQRWGAQEIHLTFAAGPEIAPVFVAQRAKGRLQHALRQALGAQPDSPAGRARRGLTDAPGDLAGRTRRGLTDAPHLPAPGDLASPERKVAFSRKVSVRAIGHNLNATVERYIRDQLVDADLADPRYRASLARAAVLDPSVDLDQPAETDSGHYWQNLHVVLVTASRFRIPGHEEPSKVRRAAENALRDANCALKALAVMPDHLHAALRGDPRRSPAEIAVGLQNATAEVPGFRLWQDAFYVGTFGVYDLSAVH